MSTWPQTLERQPDPDKRKWLLHNMAPLKTLEGKYCHASLRASAVFEINLILNLSPPKYLQDPTSIHDKNNRMVIAKQHWLSMLNKGEEFVYYEIIKHW